MTGEPYGPHPAAVAHAQRTSGRIPGSSHWDAIAHGATAAHDPALGLARSVCLRDVIDWLRAARYENPRTGGERAVPGWKHAAEALEREFTRAR